jgi:hypothetical protein
MAGGSSAALPRLRAWLLLLYMAAWITQSMAEFLHLQIFTLLLAGFGAWSLQMAYHPTGKLRVPAMGFQEELAYEQGHGSR